MHLVQLFLPAYGADNRPFPKAMFDAVRAELAARFGGVTAYLRSPAVGCGRTRLANACATTSCCSR